jgi:thiol-disulfide isomerase/thioredoxin/uncharacterized small protein (DUF1192 family)
MTMAVVPLTRILALLAVLATLFPSSELWADSGTLRFTPEQPRAGERITVEYRASGALAPESRLVLRAYYRSTADEPETRLEYVRVTELRRVRDGAFRGTFRLPRSAVYAAFAVENAEAGVVDSNGRELWELLVHDPGKRPLFEALEQRVFDLTGRNWPLSLETVRTITELYPGQVRGWFYRAAYESRIAGEAGIESVLALHRTRLAELERDFASKPTLHGDQVGWLGRYAWAAGDPEAGRRWEERLMREFPTHPLAVQLRAVEISRASREDPTPALAQLEQLWEEAGAAHGQFLDVGFDVARRAGDPDAIRRWADRRETVMPWTHRSTALALASVPELREEGMQRLRREIARLDAVRQEDRDLRRTSEAQRVQNHRDARTLFAALGQALLASGQPQAGLDTLRLAAAGNWNPRLFGQIAETEIALGNTAQALEMWARVAVDPGTQGGFADSVRTRLGTDFNPGRWDAAVSRGRANLQNYVLEEAVERPLPTPVQLMGGGGETHSLSLLANGEVTLVAFWSRYCGHSLDALPQLQRTADRLSAQGVRVVKIIDESISAELEDFLAEKGLGVPVFYDAHGAARTAFNQWGTPQYFVLDRTGQIRFEYSSLPAVLRQVQVLQDLERSSTYGNGS